MSHDEHFMTLLVELLEHIQTYHEDVFFEFIAETYHVKDVVRWYVEFQHSESTEAK